MQCVLGARKSFWTVKGQASQDLWQEATDAQASKGTLFIESYILSWLVYGAFFSHLQNIDAGYLLQVLLAVHIW